MKVPSAHWFYDALESCHSLPKFLLVSQLPEDRPRIFSQNSIRISHSELLEMY